MDNLVGILTAVVAAIISVYTLASSIRKNSFNELKDVVELLKEEIAKLKIELGKRERTIVEREVTIAGLVNNLKDAINTKDKFVSVLEDEFKETKALKVYIKLLIGGFKSKGMKFPPPPVGLLDTDPKITTVKSTK